MVTAYLDILLWCSRHGHGWLLVSVLIPGGGGGHLPRDPGGEGQGLARLPHHRPVRGVGGADQLERVD